MEINTKDYSFILEKSPQETWDQFHLRRYYICQCIDQQPDLIHSLEHVVEMSFFWISYKYMNCHLKKHILKQLQPFLNFHS